MTFTLDTSGQVGGVSWGDLEPFEQGTLEAMFRQETERGIFWVLVRQPKFSDLAPSALERVRRDCARFTGDPRCENPEAMNAETGRGFWAARQSGLGIDAGFPPQHVFLTEAGKVDLKDAG